MYTKVKTRDEIDKMREAGKILADVLKILKKNTKAGMSTKDLSILSLKEVKSHGAKPAFLGYQGYPEAICISINDEVVHGIPSKNKIISRGDLVSLDFGVELDGMIVDGAISFVIGDASKEIKNLIKNTEESLMIGLKQIKDGCRVGDIGSAIENVLRKNNHGIVVDLVGHGVGHAIHEDPNIPNFGKKNSGPMLQEGMTIAVEPMATLGNGDVFVDSDGWTVKTKDGSIACHFEHTVLITKNGYEILTTS